MGFAKWFRDHSTLPTVADQLKAYEQANACANAALGATTHTQQPGVITVGTVIEAEQFPPHTGVVIQGILCRFTEYLLDRHMILIGEIGSGKTTAVLNLLQQTACYTARDCFFINFKGERKDDEKARRILEEHRGPIRVIRMDPDNPGWKYNPFKYGDGLSIANRWIRILGLPHYEGSGEYYADLHRSAIFLICLAQEGPPRTLEEMERRLNPASDWLNKAYPRGDKNTPPHPKRWRVDLLLEKDGTQQTPWKKLATKVSPVFENLERFIGEDGLTFDDGSLIISVPASKISDTAKKIADCLVEDLKHFMSSRQRKPAQVFWDEFQAAKNDSITEFLSQARSFHCGAVLATQDINKLGTDLQQKALTSDTTTCIAFRTQQSADFVARLSGSIRQARTTLQVQDGEVDRYSVGEETEYRIHPNDVAQLPDGYCFILRQRTYAKVLFNQPVIPANVSEEPIYTPQEHSEVKLDMIEKPQAETTKPKKKPKVNERK